MYTISWLRQQHDAGIRLKYLFFWGHEPHPNGIITHSCLSQWWEGAFEVDGIVYKTAEHWMMAEKARLFGDKEMRARIIACEKPGEAKALGREVRGFDQAIWGAERFAIVRDGNYYKFSQDEALKAFLINTNQRILAEASPIDAIWGIGMAKYHPSVTDPYRWRGLNLLGFALMEVRDALISG